MFGRRDRCLLVLSQLAGVPYKHLATMTAGDIAFTDGVATITSPAGRWSLRPADDAVLCGPCAIARWLRVIDLAVTKISTSALKAAVGKADRLTDESPHLCRSNKKLNEATIDGAAVPADQPVGRTPVPAGTDDAALAVPTGRDILAGGPRGAHRDLPVDQDDDTEQSKPTPVPVAPRAVYSRGMRSVLQVERHAELQDMSGINDQLDDVDELDHRAKTLLDSETLSASNRALP